MAIPRLFLDATPGGASRRDFLRHALAAAASLGPLSLMACGDEKASSGTPGPGPLCEGIVAHGDACALTGDDVVGPYYRAGAPLRTRIVEPGQAGDPLFVSGRVLGGDCATVLDGALVEIWQADVDGIYDPVNSPTFKLRGRTMSGVLGYGFETVRPGHYAGRPRHIHYRVSYERSPGDSVVLITQLYFENDPFLDGDPFAEPGRVTCLREDSGGLHATFDIVLPV